MVGWTARKGELEQLASFGAQGCPVLAWHLAPRVVEGGGDQLGV